MSVHKASHELPPIHAAILEVVARYNRFADHRDVEGTVALYTDDGFIEGDFSTGRGPDGLRADLPAIFEMEGTLKRHVSTNHIIDGMGMRQPRSRRWRCSREK